MPGASGASVSALGDAGAPRRWADLRQRTISAAVLAPIALAGVWAGGLAFILLIGAVTLGLMAEWLRLCRPRARPAGWLAAGLAWVAVVGALLVWLRADPAVGRANVIYLVAVVWASDVGAYALGRLIGGPRLAPRISPGKTWAGAAGGLLAAAAAAAVVAKLLVTSGNFATAAALGGGLSVIGQAGDLLESAVKRRLGVKDSGQFIPGHGGLLDRLDAVLAVVPVAALLALVAGRGVALWQ